MPIFGNWTSLTKTGAIPDAVLPATEWQLRFFVQASWDASILLNTRHTDISWHWKIVDAGGGVLFDQTVDQSGEAVTLDLLATWFPNNPHIYTTVPDPAPVNEQGYCTDVDFNGYGTYFTLNFYYNTDLYQIPLPAGARLIVDHIAGSETYLLKYALAQIRTVRGATGSWAFVPEHGVWLSADTHAGQTRVRGSIDTSALSLTTLNTRYARNGGGVTMDGLISGAALTTVRMRRRGVGGALYAVGQLGRDVVVSRSRLESDAEGWEEPVIVAEGLSILGAAWHPDGSRLYLPAKTSAGALQLQVVYFGTEADTGRLNVSDVVTVTPNLRSIDGAGESSFGVFPTISAVEYLEHLNGSLRMIATVGSAHHLYVSSDDGSTFDE